MPTHKEIAEALAILTAGRIVPAIAKSAAAARREAIAFKALSRARQAETIGATLVRGGKFGVRQAITKNPYGVAAFLVYEGYIHREQLADLAISLGATVQDAAEFYESEGPSTPMVSPRPERLQHALMERLGIEDRPTKLGGIFTPGKKRKVSRANKAVKQAMTWLKAGTKAASGAKPGILPTGAFRTAVVAAGRANPNTKSKPGKGKSLINKIARRLKKWW